MATASAVTVESSTRDALTIAARERGYSVTGMTLLHSGVNQAVWRLPAIRTATGPGRRSVVAKVYLPGTDRQAVREAAWFGHWLRHNSDVIAPKPLGNGDPEWAGGHLVTWLEDLGDGGRCDEAEVGTLLRNLHELDVPDELFVTNHSPMKGTKARLDKVSEHPARVIDTFTLAELMHLGLLLSGRWRKMRWPTQKCAVHGDAGPHNTLRSEWGPSLIDFDHLAVGTPLWDNYSMLWRTLTFGEPPESYDQFLSTYGPHHDLRAPAFAKQTRLLAAAHAFIGTTYALESALDHPEWRQEARTRVTDTFTLFDTNPRPYPWKWSSGPSLLAAAGAT